MKDFVTQAAFECLLVVRASAKDLSEVLHFVCDEDKIHLPDLGGFVASFRTGLDASESASIEVVHNHPDRLLARTHSSSEPSYRKLRQVLGLHSLAEPIVVRQIRLMRVGALPRVALPPSTDDVVTALKILLLSEGQGVDVSFHVPTLEGSWVTTRNPEGWKTRKYMIKQLLLRDRLYKILRRAALPRSDMERHFSVLFREYYELRNLIAQVYSRDAFDRFERGDIQGVERERLQTQRWLDRLSKIALRLGLRIEFEPHSGHPLRLIPGPGLDAPQIAARD